MFKPLRKKKFVKWTMWALVVVFAAWGAGSVAGSRRNYAGVIFSKKISPQEYNRSYSSVLMRAKMTYGDELPKMEKFLNLKDQAWDRLILKYEARRRFIRASNKEVIARIAAFGLFQRNGVFNKRLYDYIVGTVFRTTPREFEESTRDDIIIDKLANSVTKDVRLTEDEIRQEYLSQNQKAGLSFLLIKPEDYKDDISIDDDELFAFYRGHAEDFRSPVEADVTYLRIPFAGEDEKEEARLTAEELAAVIKGGETLEEVSKEYGLGLKETGFFSVNSTIPEIGLSYPFALAALNLRQDETSDIVETSDSFCIMKLKSRKDPVILPFDEAKDKAHALLIREKAQSLAEADAQDLLNRIREEGLSLEAAAERFNSKVLTSKETTRNSYIEEIGPSDSFAEMAFSLETGGVAGPARTEKGYAVIRLDSLEPVDEEDFQQQKNALAVQLLQNKKMDYFQKWFMDIKRKADLKSGI